MECLHGMQHLSNRIALILQKSCFYEAYFEHRCHHIFSSITGWAKCTNTLQVIPDETDKLKNI